VNLNDSLVLSATGRRVHAVGKVSHQQFTTRGWHVSIEWFHEGRSCEPIMVLWPASGGAGCAVWGICLSSIGKYADPSGGPTRDAVLEVRSALRDLWQRSALDVEIITLLDVILTHTPDLIRCPPEPYAMRLAERGEALLDITVKQDGKVLKEDRI
jgi:hypothetical protein